MVTLDGTESAAVLLAIATAIELPAAAVNDTVHVLDALLPNVAGEHEIPVNCVCVCPVRFSVTVFAAAPVPAVITAL
jgi:hypothetical protein